MNLLKVGQFLRSNLDVRIPSFGSLQSIKLCFVNGHDFDEVGNFAFGDWGF